MEYIRCILCGRDNPGALIEENGYQGRKCSQCNLIYISPRPSFDEIVNLYGHDEANISAETHIANRFLKRLYAKHNLHIIREFRRKGSLLEIGAGGGYFLDEARALGFEPYAIEFNPQQAKHIREELNIPCEQSPLSSHLFQGRKFDVLYHCDVTSHFFDPISEFKKMNEALNDDGLLVFETGNLGEVEERRLKKIRLFQYPDHLFFFGERSLRVLLDGSGFDIVKMFRYSIAPQLFTARVLGRLGRILPVSEKPHSRAYVAWHRFTDLVHYLVRYKIGVLAPKEDRPQTIIVVARKKA